MGQKNLRPKKIWSKKFRTNKFRLKKVSKNFWSKRNLCPTKFLVQQNFWSEKQINKVMVTACNIPIMPIASNIIVANVLHDGD